MNFPCSVTHGSINPPPLSLSWLTHHWVKTTEKMDPKVGKQYRSGIARECRDGGQVDRDAEWQEEHGETGGRDTWGARKPMDALIPSYVLALSSFFIRVLGIQTESRPFACLLASKGTAGSCLQALQLVTEPVWKSGLETCAFIKCASHWPHPYTLPSQEIPLGGS